MKKIISSILSFCVIVTSLLSLGCTVTEEVKKVNPSQPKTFSERINETNVEKVKTTATFTVNASVSEDENREDIIPHFTIESGMVMQRRAVNLIKGFTSSSNVAVYFEGNYYYGQVENGSFKVYLPPFEALYNKELVIYTENSKLTLNSICVGEVILLGGQSNMAWSFSQSPDEHNEDRLNANNDYIRCLRMDIREALSPQTLGTNNSVWSKVAPDYLNNFSIVGYLFGENLQKALQIPVGLVMSARGGTTVSQWMPEEYYVEYNESHATDMFVVNDGSHEPTQLYNGMINPLIDMSFRMVLWYQGETNSSKGVEYEDELTALINTYREIFNNPYLAYTIIELPRYVPSSQIGWANVRTSQQNVAKNLDYVALSINIDLGDKDIHPRNKTEYSLRASEVALYEFFGIGSYKYPTVKEIKKTTATKVEITLENVGDGITLKNGANGFEYSLNGSQYIAVQEVEVVGKDKVIVTVGENTKYIRYGVQHFTDIPKNEFVTVFNSYNRPLDQFVFEF